MKIGFFGTPEIALYCLERLHARHQIFFVVTGEDKPAGRNRKLQSSPVKKFAEKNGIPVLQPASLKTGDFFNEIKKYQADIFVVVAYGKIFPENIFSLPEHRMINLHPSLLPRYRGAAPIEWALVNGETVTGITIQIVNERLDSGAILNQKTVETGMNMTAGELYDIILPLGAELLLDTIDLISAGKAVPRPQDESVAVYYGKIGRDDARIDWSGRSLEIHNKVRGFNPKPGAWTTFRGKHMKILRTALFNEIPDSLPRPGRLIAFHKGRLLAGTGDGILEILQIQPETKKPMDGLSFINGYRLKEDDFFGS